MAILLYLRLHISTGGEVEFSVDREGHSSIESSESPNEQITITMETPLVKVWGVSRDRVTYDVYITESSGLIDIPTHGILGGFLALLCQLAELLNQSIHVELGLNAPRLWFEP